MKILSLLPLISFSFQATNGEGIPAKFLLKRDWETGMEHRVLCESWIRGKSQSREARNLGATTSQMLNEFNFTVWANPEGGRLFGLQYLVNCVDTRGPGLAMGFDSRKLAKGIKQDAASTGTWQMIANSWTYFDEQGQVAGKTGVGWGNHSLTFDGYPTPFGTISKPDETPVIQQFTAPVNLPKEPVAVGHRWKADLKGKLRDVGMVTAKAECEFKRIEKVKDRECAVIGFRADFKVLPTEEGNPGEQVVENPLIEGESWLELSTGTPVLEKSTTLGIQVSENGRSRFAIDNSDHMELLTKTPINPVDPLPLPLRSEEVVETPVNGGVSPMEEAPAREGAVRLKYVWKTGTRYVWSTRISLENRLDMGNGMKVPSIKADVENEDEELVLAGEGEGITRHEVKNLALLVRKPDQGGKVVFDSRQFLEKADVDYEAWRMTWKEQTGSHRYSLKGAQGKITRQWVERIVDGQAPAKDEPTSWQMKGLQNDWFANGFLPNQQVIPGKAGRSNFARRPCLWRTMW